MPQTAAGCTVECHLFQPPEILFHDDPAGLLVQFLIILAVFNQKTIGPLVGGTKVQDTFCWLSVSSCPSGFLIIAFHILRHIIMNDKTHIRFINTHAERIGCHHDLSPVINKVILILTPFCIRQSRMVSGHRKSCFSELITYFFHTFSGKAVHNAAASRHFFFFLS